jgi:transketolase
MTKMFGPRRADWIVVEDRADGPADAAFVEQLTAFDLVYRSLVAVMFNFAQSGHPGGSVSSGRIVESLLFDAMDYDIGDPQRLDQDLLSYAAGHKALGLYAMLALRTELVAAARPGMLPEAVNRKMRFEDLLGFRRNPTQPTPLFRRFGSKPLDGHPTPATPFVKLSTGASGIGMGSSLGLAFAAADHFGEDAPRVHIIEGEGGLTPGRVSEALAFAGTAGLSNAVVHLDWNQASIDSDAVTREGTAPGDYVQWDPMEFFYLQDWNVVEVADGFDIALVLAAQRRALQFDNGQPTAVVYRTVKGWRYGIEGRKSHGAGHKLCSPEYVAAMEPLLGPGAPGLPRCEPDAGPDEVEATYWATLEMLRDRVAADTLFTGPLAEAVAAAASRLDARGRSARPGAGDVEGVFAAADPAAEPEGLRLRPGDKIALRQQLGKVLGHLNEASGGAIVVGAADLLGSTAISLASAGFPDGFFHRRDNPGSRALATGGICEDGMSCILSGVSSFGAHVGAGASYGAFLAPLGHIPSRLHAIGNQARREVEPGPNRPMMLVCGHAGMKTGEDGPTHADPQALQIMQENFVRGMAVTLTPWDPAEMWPLVTAAFRARPAVIVPFVTRPGEPVLDRASLGLPPASAATEGVYRFRTAGEGRDGTLVIQGSSVAYAFLQETLPMLADAGIDLDVLYVASLELFDALPAERREEIFPADRSAEAMGITGFTLPTLYRWVRSDPGRRHSLYPFRKGHYLGSGRGEMVVHEAGLDGEGQMAAIRAYVEERRAG